MNLRFAVVLSLGVYLLALATPAYRVPMSSEPTPGWEAAFVSGQASLDLLMNPSILKGLFLGGAAPTDRLWAGLYVGGTSANLLLIAAIVCGARRSLAMSLLCASVASAAAGACLLTLVADGGFHPLIGCWLWLSSMLGLSTAAAWSVWRAEFGRVGHAPA